MIVLGESEERLFEFGEEGGEIGKKVGVRGVEDGALGDDQVIGGEELGE